MNAKSDIRLEPYPYAERSDPVAFSNYLEQRAREVMIAIEIGKVLKERMADCYRREGINHGQNCKEEVQKYADWMAKPNYGALRGTEDQE